MPVIAALLADDVLGADREAAPHDPRYLAAFDQVDADPAQVLLVAEHAGEVVGTLQLSLIPGLALAGTLRGQLEGVRVRADHRGHGLGERLVRAAIERARASGADLVQLTSNARRERARRFYERLGFTASHVGMKLYL